LITTIEQMEPEEAEKIPQRLLYAQARRRAAHLPERQAQLRQLTLSAL
jgi:hypothetical protein